jgi:hypothetical protein
MKVGGSNSSRFKFIKNPANSDIKEEQMAIEEL